MAEVVDWSPVDESNNSPPPVGAPEHHAPSATNNIMRAMMGSIRRWHDSITTQLGNYLPLTGGTLTGNAAFNGPLGIAIQGTWLNGDGTGNLIVRNVAGGDTGGAVLSMGYGASFLFSDRDMTSLPWTWYANAGTAMFGRYAQPPTVSINSAGLMTVTGNLTATGNVAAAGQITGTYAYSSGNIVAGGNISAGGNVSAGGDITCVTLATSGNIYATGSLNGAYIESSGGMHIAGNTVIDGTLAVGASLTTANISATNIAATNITGTSAVHGNTSLSTNDAVGGQSYALFTVGATSYLQFLSQPGNANRWEFDGTNGDVQYRSLNAVHWVMRRSPIGSSDNMCFNALGPVGGYGAYYNSSDRRFKQNIGSLRYGLDAILSLDPVSFSRIERSDREVGFIAQELREVIPEAVRVVGIPLPDGTGGPEDENPTLGVDTTPIIAALVNAMKEISGRISILEGRRHE